MRRLTKLMFVSILLLTSFVGGAPMEIYAQNATRATIPNGVSSSSPTKRGQVASGIDNILSSEFREAAMLAKTAIVQMESHMDSTGQEFTRYEEKAETATTLAQARSNNNGELKTSLIVLFLFVNVFQQYNLNLSLHTSLMDRTNVLDGSVKAKTVQESQDEKTLEKLRKDYSACSEQLGQIFWSKKYTDETACAWVFHP